MKGQQDSHDGEKTSLEERVLHFLGTRPGAESIDKLTLTPAQRDAEKADFFLAGRTVVCEVKSLQTDTKAKIQALMEPLLESEHAPIFYGKWTTDNVLKHFPDGETIKRQVFDAVTSAVQTLFRKANRQIRTTKDEFGLPLAEGALVIANDLVEVLSPEVIAHKIRDLFRKRTPEGKLQFPEINVVWIICETHFVEVSPGMKGIPAFIFGRDGKTSAGEVIDGFQSEWAAAHGVPLLEMNSLVFETTTFKPERQSDPKGKGIPLHEVWRRQYKKRPYLRCLNEKELGEYYKSIIAALTPGMLVGATEVDRGLSRHLIERFTHLIEEINERGIDMKNYAALMQELGRDFKAGKFTPVQMKEIEAMSNKPNIFAAGQFYSDSESKNYRCLSVNSETAVVIVIDVLLGKTLEVIGEIKRENWNNFWPIIDENKLAALKKRFEHFATKHPEWLTL